MKLQNNHVPHVEDMEYMSHNQSACSSVKRLLCFVFQNVYVALRVDGICIRTSVYISQCAVTRSKKIK